MKTKALFFGGCVLVLGASHSGSAQTYTGSTARILSQEDDTTILIARPETGAVLSQQHILTAGTPLSLQNLPAFVTFDNTPRTLTVTGEKPEDGWAASVPALDDTWHHKTLYFEAHGDLILSAPTPPGSTEPLYVELQDLHHPENTLTLTESDALRANQRHITFHLEGFEGQKLRLLSNHPITLQMIPSLQSPRGWSHAPPSTSNGEKSTNLVTRTVVPVHTSLAILALHPWTTIEIQDLSDGDDSGVYYLSPGQILTTLPRQTLTPLFWTRDGDIITTPSPFDRDILEIRSSAPILVVTGSFEEESFRGTTTYSSANAPQEHLALLVAPPGDLHIFSSSPAPLSLTPVLSLHEDAASFTFSAQDWTQGNTSRLSAPIEEEAVYLLQSTAPFAAFSVPSGEDECCPWYFTKPLENSLDLPPIARAGSDLRACPRENVSISALDSFDPDLLSDGPPIASYVWDLNLQEDSDGDGNPTNDIDVTGPQTVHSYRNSGLYQARITVTDNEGRSDTDDIDIQVLTPANPACGEDADDDGIGALQDNCPHDHNPTQGDLDRDNMGDICDSDIDGDGVLNIFDRCPRLDAPDDQEDNDNDGQGNPCDDDDDNDTIPDDLDKCPFVASDDQNDLDEDGEGDVCDNDLDGDGVPNQDDLCPRHTDPEQIDTDHDNFGDACDGDRDNDLIPNHRDNCPLTPNPGQDDINGNGRGDACDPDEDRDSIPDDLDKCPQTPDPGQEDLDRDNIGDACDPDDDGDFVPDLDDNCPRVYNPLQRDSDANGIGDICEPDADGDLVPDYRDNCPLTPNPSQDDLDRDTLGDACDSDTDGDGLSNTSEPLYNTRADSFDTDGDSLSDGEEANLGTDPTLWDTDNDGLSDDEELEMGLDPLSQDTDGDAIPDGSEPGWREDSDRDGLINANDPDSDNGGKTDGEEISSGRNMLDPTDDLRPLSAPSPPQDALCQSAPQHTPMPLYVLTPLVILLVLRRRSG